MEKNNDVVIIKITKKINANEINGWLKEGDIFILDRGFRDVRGPLEDCGFTLNSPHSFQKLLINFLPTMLFHSSDHGPNFMNHIAVYMTSLR